MGVSSGVSHVYAADIRGYGDLTPEGIRDAVWSAVLANYPLTGTAGKTLELAGSMGEFVQNISGGGGGSGLTLAQFLALK